MTEIWRDIKGYEGLYQVSNLGNVKSLQRKIYTTHRGYVGYNVLPEHILKPGYIKGGYSVVGLRKDGKAKSHNVHKLVAEAFIDNPDNLPEINHIDENKQNNKVTNLEWCTHKHNMNTGTVAQRIGNGNRGKTRSPEQLQIYHNAKLKWWKNKKSQTNIEIV